MNPTGADADVDPFAPEAYRQLARAIADRLAEHLAATRDRAGPVLRWQDPDARLASLPPLTGTPIADAGLLLERLLAESNRLHHPGFVGHQVNPTLPLAAAWEQVNALLNNGMAVYEMGPIQTAMERRAVQWMCARLGLPDDADGLLTSGGSLGNLTALLAARQAARPDTWQTGGHDFCVLASDQAHYCIDRAARVLGWGEQGVVPVPVDAAFRMRPDALAAALATARRRGRTVAAVVASACSTATGSFDPLPELADFCRDHGLWLHVDGAHGASFLLSPRHRDRLRGIERADSVVWDAHKMMGLPALVTGVLFRDGARARTTFAQDASYLFQDAAAPWWNLGQRTLECTKRGMGVSLYVTLAVLGEDWARTYVERCAALARELAERVAAAPDFQLAVPPEANIVCFRLRPADVPDAALDALQERVRQTMLRQGEFYLVQTRLPAGLFLRCCLMNPRTTPADLDRLLACLRAAAG